ncbi:RHS repeat-associated core domain-containing protein [Microbulbifer sp. MLAF003]|uniref:RHS repeat-associated core domain-containing protein n=1 Tax=Microbulbifer sp. MLAF003 TaxID=3032582 RepID=UPI0024AD027A|nr:RHS repeat-associated core domain-containing protein [Microbulbifer sp. MLAF003]WHI49963.1 RHS repeat-associated core domain-containing protein [Microbulbifer sp. MLAF003]
MGLFRQSYAGYTVFDKPSLISKGGHDTRFSYGPDRSRFKRVDDNGKGTVTTLQIGSVEKVIERSTTGAFIKSFYRRNIAGVAIERIELNASDEIAGTSTQYLHKDLQGSLDVITDSTGQVAKDAAGNKLVYSFDAWGKRRNALSWEQIAGVPENTVSALSVGAFNHLSSNRGYTGHEMLDEVGLIHMNGRVYDPTLARFVSADPLIDGITSVQGYNRYAYVHNNPLTYTDPSGYSSWNKYRDSVVKPAIALAITIYSAGTASGAAWGYFGTAVTSTQATAAVLIGGAAAGAVQSGTVKGAFFGAFSAVAFMGIGNAFQGATWATKGVVRKGVMGTGLNSYGYAAKVFAHSVTGGLLSEAQGGKFKHGFAAAGVTQAFAGGIDSIDAGNVGFSAAGVIAAAIVGGTASAVSGGKFANGAITAAFSRAFNEENHPTAQKGSVERLRSLASGVMQGKYDSAKSAAAALHTDEGLMSYIKQSGLEAWAVIDKKTFSIKEIGFGSAHDAEGVYDGMFRLGDSVWHSHPSGRDAWTGDLGSIANAGGRWIFASGDRLTGFDLWTTGYASSGQIRRDWGRGNVTMHAYGAAGWTTEEFKF